MAHGEPDPKMEAIDANSYDKPGCTVRERVLQRFRIRPITRECQSGRVRHSNRVGRREAEPDAIGGADARKRLRLPAGRYRADIRADSRARGGRELRILLGGERRKFAACRSSI